MELNFGYLFLLLLFPFSPLTPAGFAVAVGEDISSDFYISPMAEGGASLDLVYL